MLQQNLYKIFKSNNDWAGGVVYFGLVGEQTSHV